VAARNRLRPETALTRLQLAELLAGEAVVGANPRPLPVTGKGRSDGSAPPAEENATAGGERDLAEAREHLAFVIPEFEAMQMRPALERALRLRERLAGPNPRPLPRTGEGAILPAAHLAAAEASTVEGDGEPATAGSPAPTDRPFPWQWTLRYP